MAHAADESQLRVEIFRNYLEGVAKKLADDLWGPRGPGWGTRLTELEDLALAARDILSQKLVELGLERQAQAIHEQLPAEATACAGCLRPFDEPAETAPRDASPRTLQTRGGEVHWDEPQAYCPRCRRAFFPSEPKSGD
jgi:hypothetical protein